MIDPQWHLGSGYELLATYPAGAGGAVWLVRVEEDGSERAIKILRPELTFAVDAVDEFSALIETVRGLGHPGILVADETVVHGNRVALVMRRMPVEDLRTLLDRRLVLTPATTALMVADLCDALAAAHAARIVHGDVKPSNVLVELDPESGEPRAVTLADFGLAALAARSGMTVLPAEYRAPEVTRGEHLLTPASDIYALGIVLYEALAGHAPFVDVRPDYVARMHRVSQPPRIPALPDALWLLVAACLSKQPQQRPSAAELAELLRDIAPTIAAIPALANDDTVSIERIPAAGPTMPVTLLAGAAAATMTAAASAEIAATPASPAMTPVAMSGAAAGAGAGAGAGPEGPHTVLRRPSLTGPRSVALAVCSGVVVVAISLALLHTVGGSAPETLTVGSATSSAVPLGNPSSTLAITLPASPTSTPTQSALATSTPSLTPSTATKSATPSTPTSTAPGTTSSSTSESPTNPAGASSPPTTTTTSAPPPKTTISWQCATNQGRRSALYKKACIGIGSNGGLYVEGIFTDEDGQGISNIEVALAAGGQYFDATSESCGASSCSITGGPYNVPGGNYEAFAGVDDWSRNVVSPSVGYSGG